MNHDQSLRDAFLAFSEFAAKVRCGHTQANPFNQQKSLIDALFKSPTRVPFYFDWLDGRMVVTRDFTPDHHLPPGKRFGGRVFVLIDATNSSATFQFAQAIRTHKLGTLVGEPTGGSQRGINGGAFFFLRLPHSGIEMDLPLIGTFPATPAPDAGLAPDIFVKKTAAQVAAGQDAGLLAVTSALRK